MHVFILFYNESLVVRFLKITILPYIYIICYYLDKVFTGRPEARSAHKNISILKNNVSAPLLGELCFK